MAMFSWWLMFVVTVRCDVVHFKYKQKVDINKTGKRSAGQFQIKSLIQCSTVCSIQDKHCFFFDKIIERCSPDVDEKHCNYNRGCKQKVDINKTGKRSAGQFQIKSLIQCSTVCSIQDKHCFFSDKITERCSPDADEKHCNYNRGMEDRMTDLPTVCPLQKQQKVCNRDKSPSATQPEWTTEARHTEDLKIFQYNRNISLHQACGEDKLNVVKYILSQGLEDINCREKLGRTPVMAAARRGHFKMFDYLVSQCCDLSAVDHYKNNVLHVACMVGNADIVRKLIVDYKCDTESKGKCERRPIMWAACLGHREVFELLLGIGCNLTAVDNQKNNILHIACARGHVDMVKYILSQSIVSIESRGYLGRTPVMIAAGCGHKNLFDFLVRKGCDLKKLDVSNHTILHIPCKNGHLDIVQYIVSHSLISIESKGLLRRTPLLTAATHGKKEVFDFLAKNGCKQTALDAHKDNILHLSCYYGHIDMVKHILSQNIVSIESIGLYGRTPVMLAVLCGHNQIFDFLHSKNCSLRAVDDQGNTILHVACIEIHVDMVKHLMTLGVVDGMEKVDNKYGHTPIQVAETRGHIAVVKLLKRRT